VLYVSLGEPQAALTVEDRDGVLVRKDPKSGKPVAVTVVDYAQHFRNLEDVSWICERGLPKELVDFLRARPDPSLVPSS
jgi:hypothetical protein